MVTVKDHIRSILYFEGIAEDELAYVAQNSLMRTFTASEKIFLEGEPAAGKHLFGNLNPPQYGLGVGLLPSRSPLG
ncbi:MAG TPA: hypothetical protein VKY59_06515 [Spirillospora sp.]|nr:hypothetical protein [Spirillospora sp.]